MQLDIRPVSILTRAIVDSAPAWVFLHQPDISRSVAVHPSDELRMGPPATPENPLPSVLMSHLRHKSYYREHNPTCYPCKADAPFKPIPWPVVPEEVEIKEWRGLDWDVVPVTHYWPALDEMSWRVWDTGFPGIKTHHRMHPAPRRQINADGTETPVWVWEADR